MSPVHLVFCLPCSFGLQLKAFLPGGKRVARKTQDATDASTAKKLRELEDSLRIAYRSR